MIGQLLRAYVAAAAFLLPVLLGTTVLATSERAGPAILWLLGISYLVGFASLRWTAFPSRRAYAGDAEGWWRAHVRVGRSFLSVSALIQLVMLSSIPAAPSGQELLVFLPVLLLFVASVGAILLFARSPLRTARVLGVAACWCAFVVARFFWRLGQVSPTDELRTGPAFALSALLSLGMCVCVGLAFESLRRGRRDWSSPVVPQPSTP